MILPERLSVWVILSHNKFIFIISGPKKFSPRPNPIFWHHFFLSQMFVNIFFWLRNFSALFFQRIFYWPNFFHQLILAFWGHNLFHQKELFSKSVFISTKRNIFFHFLFLLIINRTFYSRFQNCIKIRRNLMYKCLILVRIVLILTGLFLPYYILAAM